MKFWPIAILLLATGGTFASPGAHGPNGEHLDAPSQAAAIRTAAPRIEAFTDQFEIVGTLYESELSIFISDYATNAPVLGAVIEVESEGLTAKATYHADAGDYAFDDPKLVERLHAEGTHQLVFTVLAGERSDLLDASLAVTATSAASGHDHYPVAWLVVAGAVSLALTGWLVVRRRRGGMSR